MAVGHVLKCVVVFGSCVSVVVLSNVDLNQDFAVVAWDDVCVDVCVIVCVVVCVVFPVVVCVVDFCKE